MLAAASVAVGAAVGARVAAEQPKKLPAEFHGPVDYSDRWIWIAVLAVVAVVLYYAAVLLFTRPRRQRQTEIVPVVTPDIRSVHLARIDAIEAKVRDGEISARDGHQGLSEVVREYVEVVTPLPARTMTLADFRLRAPRPLADTIAVMYPPEFAPDDDGVAHEAFDDALRQARGLVGTWR